MTTDKMQLVYDREKGLDTFYNMYIKSIRTYGT